jgi:hypothetical protein
MRFGWNRNGHRIDAPDHLCRGRDRRIHESRNLPRPRFVDIDDARQLDLWQLGENPGVVPPERPDADHRYACLHEGSRLIAEHAENAEPRQSFPFLQNEEFFARSLRPLRCLR